MRTLTLMILVLGSLTFGLVARRSLWTVPLYTSHVTWQGGRVDVQTYYDSVYGVQKRLVDLSPR